MKHLITSKFGSAIVSSIKRLHKKLYYKYNVEQTKNLIVKQKELADRLFKNDLTVKNGPFKGMKLSGFDTIDSAVTPKVLGSYESELHPVIGEIIKKGFWTSIINIGAADGYYTAGLARIFPSIPVFVFDNNEESARLVQKLIQKNELTNSFSYHSTFKENTLGKINAGDNPLIFCDCDGCERFIFTENNLIDFKKATLVIELHGHHDVRNSTHVLSLFSRSHEITLIQNESRDEIKYPELEQLESDEAQIALSEFRAGFTEWVYLKPIVEE